MYCAIVLAMLGCFSGRAAGKLHRHCWLCRAIYGGMVDDSVHDVHVYHGLWLDGTTGDLMVNG